MTTRKTHIARAFPLSSVTTSNVMHKARIARAFSAAAAGYDEHAQVQNKVARRLAAEILSRLPHHGSVLDIGCGTGEMAMQLAPHWHGCWLMTDLAHSMVRQARHRQRGADFVVMDGERPAVRGEFQLIVSNLAAQWFADLPRTLGALLCLLAPGGHLALTTLGADNFCQWNLACARAGVNAGTHPYPTLPQLLKMLPKKNVVHAGQYTVAIPLTQPASFLRILKGVGAHVPRPSYRELSVGEFRRVLKELSGEQVMTYHILEIIASR